MSPTQRTLHYLRGCGFTAAVVEHWNAYAKIRQDLFGFCDVIAFNEFAVVLVQATTMANMSARRQKIEGNAIFKQWKLGNANRSVWLIGWAKRGDRGKRKTWKNRIEIL